MPVSGRKGIEGCGTFFGTGSVKWDKSLETIGIKGEQMNYR